MKKTCCFIIFFLSSSIFLYCQQTIEGEYSNPTRGISANISKDNNNNYEIKFTGLQLNEQFILFPIDQEFIAWFIEFFGDVIFADELENPSSACTIKYKNILHGEIKEPKEMISKTIKYIWEPYNVQYLALINKKFPCRKYVNYFIHVEKPRESKFNMFHKAIFLSIQTDTIRLLVDDNEIELVKSK